MEAVGIPQFLYYFFFKLSHNSSLPLQLLKDEQAEPKRPLSSIKH